MIDNINLLEGSLMNKMDENGGLVYLFSGFLFSSFESMLFEFLNVYYRSVEIVVALQ